MKEKLVHVLTIACFGTVFYVNSFSNFFVWNDWTLIIENFLVKDWRNLPEIFSSAFWKPLIGEPSQIYRPLVLVSFMTDFSFWGLKPLGYHLTNVVIHCVNSTLVYVFMSRYVAPMAALVGTVLFAAHPVQTGAVTYISGRAELMMAFFILSGALLFLGSRRLNSKGLYLASLPLFFFALLSKETAVIFPLWLLVADHPDSSADLRAVGSNRLVRQIGPLTVVVIYYIFQKAFVGMTVSGASASAADLWGLVLLMLQTLPLYLGFLIFPLDLHFFYPAAPVVPLVNVYLLLGIFLFLSAGIGLCYAVSFGDKAVVIPLAWFLIGLLSLWRYASFGLPFLESWIYLPSFGFFLLLALGLGRLCERVGSRVPAWIALLIAVLLGGITLSRNNDWKDEMQLSLRAVALSLDNPITLRLLGNAYFSRGRTPEAEKRFQRAVALAPEDPRLRESLGRLYSFLDREPEALAEYERMRKLTPEDPYAYWRIGRYFFRRKEFSQSENYLAGAVRLFPYSSELHNDLAQVYYLQGNLEAARTELEAALKILPYSPVIRENLAEVLRRKE